MTAFAEHAAVFTRAYTQASFTDNALRALMTGRVPMDFDGGDGAFFGQEPTLAEHLSHAGYNTQAVNTVWLLTPYAFQGFAAVDGELAQRNEAHNGVTSAETADHLIAHFDRLQAEERPFLLWGHFSDPHQDYVPHAGAPMQGDDVRARYAQELWWTDAHVGRVLAHLKRRGFLTDGVVAVTADHGEALGEHDLVGHAFALYEPILRVPLLVAGAEIPATRVHTRVRLVDLYPTLLAYAAGVVASSDGASLQPLWQGEQASDRPVMARTTYGGAHMRAFIEGTHKLIWDVRGGTVELYDLQRDPHEASNLVDVDPERAADLRRAMGEQWDRVFNDAMLARKQALLPKRTLPPSQLRPHLLAVAQRDCARRVPGACAAIDDLRAPLP